MSTKGTLFVVSAPSGAGKTSLVTALVKECGVQYNLERSVTYTTKQPRPGEVPGIDYHYIGTQTFQEKLQQGFFLEWSGAYGNYYGSPAYILDKLQQGISVIVIVDRAGARDIYRQHPEAVLIWLYVHDEKELLKRLKFRGSETKSEINKRLKLARQEINEEIFNRLFQYHIQNDSFEKALSELKSIVFDHVKNSAFFGKPSSREKKVKKYV